MGNVGFGGFDDGCKQFDNFNCIGINIFKLFVGKIIFLWRNLQYKQLN